MIDPESFIKGSPFSEKQEDMNYNITNTTPDLLKFQLQEQYRETLENSKMYGSNEIMEPPSVHAGPKNAFHDILQANIDQGNVMLSDSLPSLTSTPTSDESEFELDTFIMNNSKNTNYLHLRILIENSIFDSSKIKKDAILTLSSLKNLKMELEDKQEVKQYLEAKAALSQEFISNIILGNDSHEDSDALLLKKVLKSSNQIQSQLLKVNREIEAHRATLNNHNLACLVLGYVEDVKLTSMNNSTPSQSVQKYGDSFTGSKFSKDLIEKSFDGLFSHIASIAAERNISLPSPPSPSVESEAFVSKMSWAQNCIDTVLKYGGDYEIQPQTPIHDMSMTNMTIPSIGSLSPQRHELQENSFLNDSSILSGSIYKSDKDKIISEYKTALNDLRFSHQYLAKEYEYSRESYLKTIQEYRKRTHALEKELTSLKQVSSDHNSVISKDREIGKLRKELNFLKIEALGSKNPSSPNLNINPLSPNPSKHNISLSTTDLPDNIDHNNDNYDDEQSDSHSVMSAFSPTRPASGNGFSYGILRKEFRKIVNDVQDQYELELGEERMRRRKLEEELEEFKLEHK